ncbi:lipase member M [Plutella xylostella]|uniref:lipase member M n=1 Tax=Plutella xylostella TaxID=51655 RepID=UPI002032B497|nr:lipase member M [Plutella xylostella]
MNYIVLSLLVLSPIKSVISGNIFEAVKDQNLPLKQNDATVNNFTQVTRKLGYETTVFEVTTEDGYISKMFRMHNPNCTEIKKKPIMLIHGLLESADAYLDLGPGAGLGYLTSDACYDVWFPNIRGNYYARAHKTLNPDTDREFWRFYGQEMAVYDIPAFIDFVLDKTGQKQLNLVTFSLSGGLFFMTTSDKPEYNDKVSLYIPLAPATRLKHSKSTLLRLLATGGSIVDTLKPVTRLGEEILYRGSGVQSLMELLCSLPNVLKGPQTVCSGFIGLLDSFHPGSISAETDSRVYFHFPAGTSLKTLSWLGQLIEKKTYQKFDYGAKKNMELYQCETAPHYDVSKMTVPTVTFHGKHDHLVDSRDMKWLLHQMPNVLEYIVVDDPLWNHLDMVHGSDAPKLVYAKIMDYLKKYE